MHESLESDWKSQQCAAGSVNIRGERQVLYRWDERVSDITVTIQNPRGKIQYLWQKILRWQWGKTLCKMLERARLTGMWRDPNRKGREADRWGWKRHGAWGCHAAAGGRSRPGQKAQHPRLTACSLRLAVTCLAMRIMNHDFIGTNETRVATGPSVCCLLSPNPLGQEPNQAPTLFLCSHGFLVRESAQWC